MAETLEAQAASLRREAARLERAGEPELPLADDGWRDWAGGDEPPADAVGKVVDVQLRTGSISHGPSIAWNWNGHNDSDDIVRYRIAAEQPAAT